jgi:hypothetical protein
MFIGTVPVIFLAVAAFVFYLSTTFSANTLNEMSAIKFRNVRLGSYSAQTVLYATIGLLILLAVCILVMLWIFLKQRKGHFELHENGVVRQIGGGRVYTPFGEIQDLYMFASGRTAYTGLINNFAYRTGSQKEWITANTGLRKFDDFLVRLRELHVAHRIPLLQQEIAAGHRVTFRYINTPQVYWKRFAGGFLRVKTRELSLSRKCLHVDDATWPYEQLQQIDVSAWTERMAIKDVSGNVVFSCNETGMLSADVFRALLGEQQK